MKKKQHVTLQVSVAELEILIRGLSDYRCNRINPGEKQRDAEATALKNYLGAKLEENDA